MTEESTVDDFPASTDLQDADSQWSPPRKGAANAMASFFNDGTLHTRNLILRGVAGIYLMAFIGFYHQSPGNLVDLFFVIYIQRFIYCISWNGSIYPNARWEKDSNCAHSRDKYENSMLIWRTPKKYGHHIVCVWISKVYMCKSSL